MMWREIAAAQGVQAGELSAQRSPQHSLSRVNANLLRTYAGPKAAASLLAAAGQAAALTPEHPARELTVERLDTSHVDFRDAAQVDAIDKRLQRAAMFACGADAFNDPAERAANRQCAEAAVRDAVNRLNRPMLTAAHQQSGAPTLAQGD